jgi:hypothetical protein
MPSNLSRVDNGYTGCLEMAHIPGHNRHAMNERSGVLQEILHRYIAIDCRNEFSQLSMLCSV